MAISLHGYRFVNLPQREPVYDCRLLRLKRLHHVFETVERHTMFPQQTHHHRLVSRIDGHRTSRYLNAVWTTSRLGTLFSLKVTHQPILRGGWVGKAACFHDNIINVPSNQMWSVCNSDVSSRGIHLARLKCDIVSADVVVVTGSNGLADCCRKLSVLSCAGSLVLKGGFPEILLNNFV